MPTSPKSAGASRCAMRISDAQERTWLDHLAAAVHATPRASDWSRLFILSADGPVDAGAGWLVTVSLMRVSPIRIDEPGGQGAWLIFPSRSRAMAVHCSSGISGT